MVCKDDEEINSDNGRCRKKCKAEQERNRESKRCRKIRDANRVNVPLPVVNQSVSKKPRKHVSKKPLSKKPRKPVSKKPLSKKPRKPVSKKPLSKKPRKPVSKKPRKPLSKKPLSKKPISKKPRKHLSRKPRKPKISIRMQFLSEDCPVCMEPIKDVKVLKCKHELCEGCWNEWSKQSNKCPLCRNVEFEQVGNLNNQQIDNQGGFVGGIYDPELAQVIQQEQQQRRQQEQQRQQQARQQLERIELELRQIERELIDLHSNFRRVRDVNSSNIESRLSREGYLRKTKIRITNYENQREFLLEQQGRIRYSLQRPLRN